MEKKKRRKTSKYIKNCTDDYQRAMGMMLDPSVVTPMQIVKSAGVSLRTAQRMIRQIRAAPSINWRKIRGSGYIQLPN